VRPPVLRLATSDLIVDNFAGGGGASTGIEWALGRSPDIAINHDPEAVAMHAANHPTTKHFCESVWAVDPKVVCGGRRVRVAWFSPDCKHFSKAKGGKPVDKKIRSLAWVVNRWAHAVKPDMIFLENVEEFQDWGPLLDDGTPDPARKSLTFRIWVGKLRAAGYRVEWRLLSACDYGAPTTRKRLFLIARSDGRPIVWPEPTHGPGRLPFRTAAECIDFTLPVRSIFGRKKPLAENTHRRIARGLVRHVIENPNPFIVPGGFAPTLIQTGYGERVGQAPRTLNLFEPLGTVVGGGVKHALVAAWLAKHYGGKEGRGASAMPEPIDTVTSRDHHALVTSHLLHLRGGLADHPVTARDLRAPVPTITAQGTHLAEVRAFLIKYYSTNQDPQLGLPLHTVTTKHRFGLVTVHGEQHVVGDIGMRMLVAPELYRAQSFPSAYIIDVSLYGKRLTATSQVRMCGNAVPPVMAEAIVRANVFEQARAEVA
jgi:DNA (cytosine-5)-methyltransferase 1